MANSVVSDQTLCSVLSDLGVHCLLRPNFPNILGKLCSIILSNYSPLMHHKQFVAYDILFFFIFKYLNFSEKISLDVSCELSAKQTIHMKCQDLFSPSRHLT